MVDSNRETGMNYEDFLSKRRHFGADSGFDATWLPDFLFPFQRDLVEWAVRKGRAAIFADCGLGKTAMQLTWAQNVVARTNKPVLLLTPLAVGPQTVKEAAKFGIDATRSLDGKHSGARVIVANYQRLHLFNPADFGGVVCDESSILKSYSGATRTAITDFMQTVPYRLLCTATPSPNDFMELGTSCEALGVMRRVEMMAQFFTHDGGETSKWRIKGHAAKEIFWRWVCSWARAVRRPSDLGYEDGAFLLPELRMNQHTVRSGAPAEGMLFDLPAVTLDEQRAERRSTLAQRCEKAAELVKHQRPALCFCHLNEEGETLRRMIPDAQEVSGADPDESKEEKFDAFIEGQIRVLVTKPKIAGLGLNFQHCAHMTYFPSHSFEEMYQSIRRSWRFGQTRPVVVDVVASEGEANVLRNVERKIAQADEMFRGLVAMMHQPHTREITQPTNNTRHIPSWIS